MSHEWFYFTLWFMVTAWLIWDAKRTNAQLNERSQAMLKAVSEATERIARYLGADRS